MKAMNSMLAVSEKSLLSNKPILTAGADVKFKAQACNTPLKLALLNIDVQAPCKVADYARKKTRPSGLSIE